ncbi:MAG: hypothetical protein Q9192_001516 [Flavoplaca navasiana]
MKETETSMLEAAIRLERAQMPLLSSLEGGRVAAACRKIGKEISTALEGRQRVAFQELCEFVEKQLEEGVVEVVTTSRTTSAEPWAWMLRVAFIVIVMPNFNDVRVATAIGVIPDLFNGKTILVTAYLHPGRYQLGSWHAAQNVKKNIAKGCYGREQREELMDSVWQWILSYTEEDFIVNQQDLISARGPADVA